MANIKEVENFVILLKIILFVYISRTKAKAVSDAIANVTDVLAKATGSQAAAKDAIDKTEQDIKTAEDILNGVSDISTCIYQFSIFANQIPFSEQYNRAYSAVFT